MKSAFFLCLSTSWCPRAFLGAADRRARFFAIPAGVIRSCTSPCGASRWVPTSPRRPVGKLPSMRKTTAPPTLLGPAGTGADASGVEYGSTGTSSSPRPRTGGRRTSRARVRQLRRRARRSARGSHERCALPCHFR